jgi:acyl-CoA thioester hydrolase
MNSYVFFTEGREIAMETEEYSKTYEVSWDGLDPIGHLRGPVLIDYSINTQMSWVAQCGYTQEKFAQAGYDPIVLRLNARYHREVLLGDLVVDTPELAGLSPDGAMWKVIHHLTKVDGEKVATIRLEGSWFNWRTREAVAPEAELLKILSNFRRTDDFQRMRPLSRT